NGTKDGSSWNNASDDIQAMINISDRCDEVWVAAGTYLPTYSADGWTESSPTGVNSNPKDQNNAFVMKTGVKVFGGFAGNETDLEQQNWIKNRTILSGDFNGDDGDTRADDASHAENAYHVVISAGAGSDTELNGFTVQGGGYFTNFDDLEQDTRAITVNGEAVGLRNGGGIHVINSSVSLQNLDIQGNGGGDGGGIYCVNSSEARGYNLNIHKNSGRSGGGINVTNCNAKFKNLVVSQNSGLYGGGISNVAGLCRPEYLNMMVVDNQADFYGGFGAGMHNNTSAPIITNATIVYNYGGQCAGMINSVSAYPVINNSIIWDNHALQASNWYPYVDNVCTWSGSVTYNNSLLQDTDLSSVGGLDATQPGFDLMIDPSTAKLYENSPCIDAGSDALYEAACGSDFLGRENEYTITLGPDAFYPGKETPRFVGAGIDIGACEYYVVPPPPSCDGPGVIRYVTQTGNGTKDGSSWNNASDDIQAMINISDRCDEVWAAEGIYTPTHNAEGWTENIPTGINSNSNDRNNAFVMKAGVRVYGGFTGNETDTDQRNWFDDRTILSGDFNNDDDENDYYNTYKENAYHVVIAANIGDETVLDGFTVRGGNIYDSYPGTVINVNGASVASDKGGGIYADNANIKLKNIEIRNNAAPNIGGGLYCVKSSGLRGENLYFYKNFASNGGGIFVSDCSPNFKNIILAENQAGVGAGVSNSGGLRNENGNWISDISSPHYTNVFIHSNIGSPVNGYGAGMQNERSSPVITNSTIAGNYGGIEAAGIYNYYNCNPIVNNSIIWNNSIASGIYNVKDDNDCVTTYNYSVLQGVDLSLSGGLNAAAPGFDPMFISPPGNVLLAPTGSFTLQTGSPCIGAGNPGLYMDALGDEFRGWDDEYALTPPPYTTWKENFTSTFFGTWYPIDDYSGKPALRLYDNQISIGAFETSDIVAFRSAPQAYVQERIELPDKNAGGKCLQMYPNPVFSNSFIQILLPEPSGTDRQNECVRVYNITGSLVLQSAVPAETTTLDLYLPIVPGYYTVKYKNMEAGLLVK
ncbi:MAG: T9SS type A sorting domain-containing protein, partial [Candidatus Azobacteroides sp.]|nr:T9SS type A sorting domain-containing protein [Candidatus Azobacteroides sp.]